MIDEQKKKQLIAAGVFFVIVVLVISVVVLISNQNNDLPPRDDTAPALDTANDSPNNTPNGSQTVKDEFVTQGITLEGFSILTAKSITDDRIGVIRFYLAKYANAVPDSDIKRFIIQPQTITQTTDGDLQKTTFSVTTNNDSTFTVELSYMYSADAFVQIFDKDGKMVQSTPSESHE